MPSKSQTRQKTCTKCSEAKDLSAFGKHKIGKDGLRSICRVCDSAQSGAWSKANRERANATARRWKAENRDRVAVSDARWIAANPEKVAANRAAYARNNPERVKATAAVGHAIRMGHLTREPCEQCGAEPADAHHDSYALEHRFDVRWLCRRHHRHHHMAEEKKQQEAAR